ncbi:MAG TPA: FAD-dependent thymidylate synthase [bacterium]|nr:FAD-dependent thymidylate synthase [bacterium]HPT29720.1 FAD-dependent thymidylate synthase [bacterium]
MANIFIYDEFSPEDTAMMQALYSRSPKSVTEHVEKVKTSGSGKFMETFYVGYGHSSIADCGSTTIFIEGLSILADKAIQDWQMYSGQETSTRYVDMSQQPIVDPLNTPESQAIIKRWMDFYISSQLPVQNYLKIKYPRKTDEDEAVYEKAIKARTFDITRGFLPAGITTQLSWHTNLRQANDKLSLMRHHSLHEMKELAENIIQQLQGKYAHSFSHKLYDEQEEYRRAIMADYNFFAPTEAFDFKLSTTIKNEDLTPYQSAIDNRPIKTNLPLCLEELGLITFDFLLDYGSFRDIQRHRHGFCRMPLLDTKHGFNAWYLNELPEDIQTQAQALIAEQIVALEKLDASPEIKQYYTAMGFNVPCRVSYGLPAAVYVVELRSGRLVHPTLRKIAHQMRAALLEKLPGLKLHCDLDPDDWDVRRGLQDIVKK